MIDWADLDNVLAPWRALGRKSPSRSRRAELHEQFLAQVEGADPLADPGPQVTLAGDWHGEAAWAVPGVETAAKAGSRLLVHLGNFGVWPGDSGEGYLDAVEMACRRHGTDVVFVDGNHEDFDRLARYPVAPCGLRPVRPHVWHLPRGHRWAWGGRTWLAVGGAASVDRSLRTPGHSWWPQETLTQDEAEQVAAAGPADVMVTHDRPSMAAAALGQTPGSWHDAAPRTWAKEDLIAADEDAALLQGVVDRVRPSRLFHGHLHERYDVVIEPTAWGGTCHVTGLDQQGRPGNLLHVATG